MKLRQTVLRPNLVWPTPSYQIKTLLVISLFTFGTRPITKCHYINAFQEVSPLQPVFLDIFCYIGFSRLHPDYSTKWFLFESSIWFLKNFVYSACPCFQSSRISFPVILCNFNLYFFHIFPEPLLIVPYILFKLPTVFRIGLSKLEIVFTRYWNL
jgi:hypothetical protein